MIHRTLVAVIAVTAALSSIAFAQMPLPPSTEFSVSCATACHFDNAVLSDGASTFTIDFTSTASTGNGTYGPIYPQGTDYLMEAFWTNGASLTTGHMHFVASGGNPGGYENHHQQGTDRQGFRITRVDGMPFQLVSLDYRSATSAVEVVTMPFSSTPTYTSQAIVYGAAEGLMLNNGAWNTYLFPSPVAVDASPTAILAPSNPVASCDFLTSAEAVTIEITNLGTMALAMGSTINVGYTINGGAPVAESIVLGAALPSLMNITHTFATPANLAAFGTYVIDVVASAAGDLGPLNDLRSKTVFSGGINGVNSFPWTENFDGFGATHGSIVPPPGWEQDQADGTGTGGSTDWLFYTFSGPNGNGPNSDHTTGVQGTGYYAVVDDNGNHPDVNLVTPCLDLSGLTSPRLKFWVHSNNSTIPSTTNENFLAIDAITYPGGIVAADLITAIGHTSFQWEFVSVDLSAFAGGTVQIRFRGRSDGGSFTHDIAIDDVTVDDNLYPGTGEDLQLTAGVNGSLTNNSQQAAVGGDVLFMHIESPMGTLNTEEPVITGQAFVTGSPAPFINVFMGDGVWLDPTLNPGPFVIFDGNAPPFNGLGLPPQGLTFQYFVGANLAGISVMLNAFSITPLAANSIFVVTEGIEIQFM